MTSWCLFLNKKTGKKKSRRAHGEFHCSVQELKLVDACIYFTFHLGSARISLTVWPWLLHPKPVISAKTGTSTKHYSGLSFHTFWWSEQSEMKDSHVKHHVCSYREVHDDPGTAFTYALLCRNLAPIKQEVIKMPRKGTSQWSETKGRTLLLSIITLLISCPCFLSWGFEDKRINLNETAWRRHEFLRKEPFCPK